jgi:hypothetical protein
MQQTILSVWALRFRNIQRVLASPRNGWHPNEMQPARDGHRITVGLRCINGGSCRMSIGTR